MKKYLILGALVLSVIFDSSLLLALPAFPGAKGFGSETPGGRGGVILHVTNLNNAGSGSLRDACSASGPRIVVFDIGGTIILDSDISIANPYITIAGQTAPGDGICLRRAGLEIKTHNVIVRGLRVRPGNEDGGPDLGNRDALQIEGSNNKYNIVIDHCSFSWSTDEIFTIWNSENNGTQNCTISYCIFSEPLGCTDHAFGILFGPGTSRITFHHNLIAHATARSPDIGGGNSAYPEINPSSYIEFYNNLIYNWKWLGCQIASGTDGKNVGPQFVHLINNYWVKGALLQNNQPCISASSSHENTRFYVSGNIGLGRESLDKPECSIARSDSQSRCTTLEQFSKSFIPTDSYQDVYNKILGVKGHGAGAYYPIRDSVDTRTIYSVQNGTGGPPDTQNDVGGWPTLSSGAPPTDTDKDGMPDSWETARGLDPKNATDANYDRNSDGYTNIEEYINGLLSIEISPPKNLRDLPT